jgi:hypothetical protein
MQKERRKEHMFGIIKDVRKDPRGDPANRQQRSRGDPEEERIRRRRTVQASVAGAD